MHSCSLLGAVACASLLGNMAHAGVVVTPSQLLWNQRVTSGGQSVGVETFNSYVGYNASGVTGDVGDVTWTASASPSGLLASNGNLRTADAFATLTFSFSKGVRGVAGNIFGSNLLGNAVPAIIDVTVSDGTAYEDIAFSAGEFIGFYSSSANITSLSITVASFDPSASIHAAIDNLYLAVPSPGAAALVGLAGLLAKRRRT